MKKLVIFLLVALSWCGVAFAGPPGISGSDLKEFESLDCAEGEIPKQVSGVWTCATDSTGTGGDQLVDIVTTSPLTINATTNVNDALPGSDADMTFAVTVAKDIVATAPVTVNAGANLDDVIVGTDADITIAVSDGSTTAKGVVELSTDLESVTGTSDAVVVTPGTLTSRLAAPGEIGGTTPAAITGTTVDGTTITASVGFVGDLTGDISGDADTLDTHDSTYFQTALTDSASLSGSLSDETGTGAAVFATNPSLIAPALGTITSGDGGTLTNLNGENIQNDSIDDDSIDFGDVTSSDFTFDNDSVLTTSVYSGTTSLEEATAANDSGAYIVGVFDEFTNSTSANVQGVLKDFDTAIAGGGSTLGDIVTTAPLAGGQDDVLPGVDADVTLTINVLKDIVATTPLTVNGGASLNDVLTGNDADVTFAMPAATNAAPGHATAAQITALETVDTSAEVIAIVEGGATAFEAADATIIKEADVDDTPVNAATVAPVSSNWAYDHANDADQHSEYLQKADNLSDLVSAATARTNLAVPGLAGGTYTGTHNFSGAVTELPNSTSLPGTCNDGELYIKTDAASGEQIYVCESNIWVQQSSGLENPMTTAEDVIKGGVAGVATRVAAVANSLAGWNNSGTFGAYSNIALSDNDYQFYDSADTTKHAQFELAGITTGNKRVYTLPDYNLTISPRFESIAIADLNDASTPHVLTIAETTNKIISSYASSGSDRIFTLPTAHTAGNVGFVIGEAYESDYDPPDGTAFYLNGTEMASNENIVNAADTVGQTIWFYCVNISGTLRWMSDSKNSDFVEASP